MNILIEDFRYNKVLYIYVHNIHMEINVLFLIEDKTHTQIIITFLKSNIKNKFICYPNSEYKHLK